MRPSERSKRRLTVEGQNDKWAIINLLQRHGFNPPADDQSTPYVHDAGSVERVLDSLSAGVRTYERYGIVIDADAGLERRWVQIRSHLSPLGITLPDSPAPGGTVVVGLRPHHRVGVWIMPNNQDPGILEDFLAKLVPPGDACWPHACEATARAREIGAPLGEKDVSKGTIHAWLAWQKQPGLPFGQALTARVLRHDTPEALDFVGWFMRLLVEPV